MWTSMILTPVAPSPTPCSSRGDVGWVVKGGRNKTCPVLSEPLKPKYLLLQEHNRQLRQELLTQPKGKRPQKTWKQLAFAIHNWFKRWNEQFFWHDSFQAVKSTALGPSILRVLGSSQQRVGGCGIWGYREACLGGKLGQKCRNSEVWMWVSWLIAVISTDTTWAVLLSVL